MKSIKKLIWAICNRHTIHVVKTLFASIRKEKEEKNMKKYWCVNYNDIEDEFFGNVGGMIYDTKDDAWNCACNDANEYLIGTEDCVLDMMPNDCRIICRNVKDNSYLCIWELQSMSMSNEFNEIDD